MRPSNNQILLFLSKGQQLLLVLVLLCVVTDNYAQRCDGNLGENLFVDGDFGSGPDNILLQNPGIAPGYNYVLQGPPNDGSYTLTNNTGAWPNIYGSWIRTRDNSTDPEGYMMVVNASYQPSIFYTQQVDGLCDNSVYAFSADILNLITSSGFDSYIDPNVTFLIDGQAVFRTGDVPKNRSWNTYRFEFATVPGQTSVVLSLRNNAPGGFGNDLAIDNISFRACGPSAQILPNEVSFACEDGDPIVLEATIEGDQYDSPAIQWQQSFDEGLTWVDIAGATALSLTHTDTRSGFYYYRYLLANGTVNLTSRTCRVISNVKTLFYQPKEYLIQDTICEGLSYQVGLSSYDQTGTYVESLITLFGCDSVVTTNLFVQADPGIASTLIGTDPSCSYIEDGTLFATEPINGTPPYSYLLNDLPILDGQQQAGLSEGNYRYQITDKYGCTLLDSIQLVNPIPFAFELGPDLTIELGDEARVNIRVSGGVTQQVTWTPAEAVECDLPCTDFVLRPMRSVALLAEAINENGCIATDSILLEVVTVRKHFFPTAFSPNGDGVNDYFTGFGESPNVQMIEELLVVDRWGNLLFSRTSLPPNNQQAGWDGSTGGKTLDEGVYVFSARVRYFDGAVERVSGEVTLVR
ncbi:MAG: T9SS type B sorting domain-containing protein [Saprospiraceae bacterium]